MEFSAPISIIFNAYFSFRTRLNSGFCPLCGRTAAGCAGCLQYDWLCAFILETKYNADRFSLRNRAKIMFYRCKPLNMAVVIIMVVFHYSGKMVVGEGRGGDFLLWHHG